MRGYKRINFEEVKASFEAEGYQLLEKEYRGAKQKLQYICTKGHEGVTNWNIWQRGCRCPICSRERGDTKRRKNDDIDKLRELFKKEGYTLLEKMYKNVHTPLLYRCPEGHEHKVPLVNWRRGTRCPTCALISLRKRKGRERVSLERFKDCLEQEGYKLLSANDFKDSKSLICYECEKGHRHYVCWNNWQQGHRCPKCQPSRSKEELDLQEQLEKTNFNLENNCREVIPPKELDFYFPDQKLAIEYCGLYWHSTIHDRITPDYHYQKFKACENKGIRLITIFADEWVSNRVLCLSRINAALGIGQKRIYARKCQITKVLKEEARKFLGKYHLQGSVGCDIAFGLLHEGILVSVMTLGKPSRAHISKKEKTLEIKRFASLPNTIVVGGASKLFKAVLSYAKENKYKKIVSYCDRRWGTGSVYEKLDMLMVNCTKYTPHYTDFTRRWRNQTFAKKGNKSEQERVEEKRVYKIYDCGHQVWEYLLK